MSLMNFPFKGEWKIVQSDFYSGSLTIEETNETYRCIWKSNDGKGNDYVGIGILVEDNLLVSRFISGKSNEMLSRGGIGLYSPLGDKRSNSALWAATQNSMFWAQVLHGEVKPMKR